MQEDHVDKGDQVGGSIDHKVKFGILPQQRVDVEIVKDGAPKKDGQKTDGGGEGGNKGDHVDHVALDGRIIALAEELGNIQGKTAGKAVEEGLKQNVKRTGGADGAQCMLADKFAVMDNVVLPVLSGVCEKLRQMSLSQIICSSKEGVALKNEMSNYTNSLRSIRDVLLDNENYISSPLYKRLKADIQEYIDHTISKMQR